jgi:3-oxoacyl-[acyl-carrier protein] reductase
VTADLTRFDEVEAMRDEVERNRQQIPGEIQRALIGNHPIRRLGTPEDGAQAALFLAADSAWWISGVVLDVAGGSVLV